jgi:malonyl-CoA O-methyltransferase
VSEYKQGYALAKPNIVRSFNEAAQNYQQVDQLQQTVADRLLERLDFIKLSPELILDLGSGPGTSSRKLASYYRGARIIETDLSLSMLRQSRQESPRFLSRRQRICSDAEILGLDSGRFDLVFSNLMLQWCDNLDQVFKEASRVLRTNGLFVFSTFGPDTLMELRQSWQQVDEEVHVNAFIDMHDIGDALIRIGMESPVMETEKLTLNYSRVHDLMRELKMIGAHNINSGRRKTLTGKNRFQSMLDNYEKWRSKTGSLPATYEVIYGHAWMPENTKASRINASTVAFPVSALKSTKYRGAR